MVNINQIRRIAKPLQTIFNENEKTNVLIANQEMVSERLGNVDLDESLRLIEARDVLVGIPEDQSSRDDSDGITNAELVAIHTNGTPNAENLNTIDNLQGKGLSYEKARSKAMDLYLESTGSPGFHIPPRPIIEPALEANSQEISQMMKEALQAYLWTPNDPEQGDVKLEELGLRAEGIVRGWFTDPQNNWPPNSQNTIAQKGSEQPLIDTGELRKAITYVIEKGDE